MAQLWFKFWAKDYLGDGKIGCLSYEKRGILQTLWAYAWEEGSIPADPGAIGDLLKISPRLARAHYEWIRLFFHPHPSDAGRLISPRLELDRQEADEKGAKARSSALQRWSKRNANALPTVKRTECAGHAGQSQSTEVPLTGVSPEVPRPRLPKPSPAPADADATPVVLELPCVGSGEKVWPVTEAKLKRWKEAFPHLDVEQEARKMRFYLENTPKKRKTFDGMGKFVSGWLGRAQNDGRNRASPARVTPLRPDLTNQGPSSFPSLPRAGTP